MLALLQLEWLVSLWLADRDWVLSDFLVQAQVQVLDLVHAWCGVMRPNHTCHFLLKV